MTLIGLGWLAAYACVAAGTYMALDSTLKPRGFTRRAKTFSAATMWPVLISALVVWRLLGV